MISLSRTGTVWHSAYYFCHKVKGDTLHQNFYCIIGLLCIINQMFSVVKDGKSHHYMYGIKYFISVHYPFLSCSQNTTDNTIFWAGTFTNKKNAREVCKFCWKWRTNKYKYESSNNFYVLQDLIIYIKGKERKTYLRN